MKKNHIYLTIAIVIPNMIFALAIVAYASFNPKEFAGLFGNSVATAADVSQPAVQPAAAQPAVSERWPNLTERGTYQVDLLGDLANGQPTTFVKISSLAEDFKTYMNGIDLYSTLENATGLVAVSDAKAAESQASAFKRLRKAGHPVRNLPSGEPRFRVDADELPHGLGGRYYAEYYFMSLELSRRSQGVALSQSQLDYLLNDGYAMSKYRYYIRYLKSRNEDGRLFTDRQETLRRYIAEDTTSLIRDVVLGRESL